MCLHSMSSRRFESIGCSSSVGNDCYILGCWKLLSQNTRCPASWDLPLMRSRLLDETVGQRASAHGIRGHDCILGEHAT